MYRFWFERSLPSEYFSLLQSRVLITGSASEDPTDPFKALTGAEAIIASARIRYDKEFFSRVPTLRVVSRTGIGYDNISVPDATAQGVAVCFAPEGPVVSTAEHAMLLIFAVAKRLREVENLMRSGRAVDYFNCHQGLELEGQELGLVGLGRIGSRVARIALAVGMRVLGYDPALSSERARDLGVDRQEHLERLLQRADIVSLHLPLSSTTQHLINETRLAQMKRGSILINTSRGGLVDETALLAALETGQLSGVGLDVFQTEPPNPNSPLLQRENVIATPHIAGVTVSSKRRLWKTAIDQALQVLSGERPAHVLNPEVLAFHRE